MTIVCFSCGTDISLPDGPVSRNDSCPSCRSDVKVCRNCAHYDPKSYNECREPQADRIVEKDRRNFCDYFTPGGSQTGSGPSKSDVLNALDALFKK